MMDTVQIVIVLLTFFLAGLVKGVIGLGLPTISLAILTVAINLESAMALMLAPSLVTNLWQGFSGCNTRYLLSRLWPFLVATATVVFIGSLLFALTVLAGINGCFNPSVYKIVHKKGYNDCPCRRRT